MKPIDATTILVGGQLPLGLPTPASMIHTKEDSAAVDYSTGITIEQDGAGDAVLHFLLTGGQGFGLGIDNSQGDKFVISGNNNGANALASSLLELDITGNLSINVGLFTPGGKITTQAKVDSDTVLTIFDASLHRNAASGGVGLGIGYLFQLENGGGTIEPAGKFEIVWTDPTDAAECSSFGISIMIGGSFAEVFQCNDTAVDINSPMRIGDGGTTNYVETEADGKVVFHGSAGLAYAGISAVSNAGATTITDIGVAVQVLIFDTDDPSNNATPDHTNDHITITKAGDYLIIVSATVNTSAGVGQKVEITVQKNNGNSMVGALHADRNFGGGGGEAGSMSMSGIAALAATDTVEVWIENETSTDNLVVEDITLTLVQIGG